MRCVELTCAVPLKVGLMLAGIALASGNSKACSIAFCRDSANLPEPCNLCLVAFVSFRPVDHEFSAGFTPCVVCLAALKLFSLAESEDLLYLELCTAFPVRSVSLDLAE